ncbi:GNAT family N-acetyltransferase [Kaarinaea lacus]
MTLDAIKIRHAVTKDLDEINRVIEAAVMTWELPERVKRLSLSSYRYTELDIKHLEIVVAEDSDQKLIGVVAWEEADKKDAPSGNTALLLHGIYVEPSHYRQGIGRQLFLQAEQAARRQHFDGLLVKAQSGAEKFFEAQGMQRINVVNAERDYANRFWKELNPR